MSSGHTFDLIHFWVYFLTLFLIQNTAKLLVQHQGLEIKFLPPVDSQTFHFYLVFHLQVSQEQPGYEPMWASAFDRALCSGSSAGKQGFRQNSLFQTFGQLNQPAAPCPETLQDAQMTLTAATARFQGLPSSRSNPARASCVAGNRKCSPAVNPERRDSQHDAVPALCDSAAAQKCRNESARTGCVLHSVSICI